MHISISVWHPALCRVYDTATHTRLGKLERPASAAADPAAPCSMLWRGGRELFVCWARHVWVLRLVGSLLPAMPGGHPGTAPGRSLQIVASFDAGCAVLGAAPFGADLAVLTWGNPAGGSGSANSTTAGEAESGGAAGSAMAEGQARVVPPTESAPLAEQQTAAAGGSAVDAAAGAEGVSAGSGQQPGAPHAAAVQGQAAAGEPVAAASQQGQPLSLSFFQRAGTLLASDALGSSCSAAERRWHQLALLYPGDADLKLSAASSFPLPASHVPVATPRRTPVGSDAGSRAGSVPSSGRNSPVRTLSGVRAGREGPGTPAVDANGAACVADGQATMQDGQDTPPLASQRAQHGPGQQHAPGSGGASPAAGAAAAVQQYKWWRDGEEPLYLVSGPQASLETLCSYLPVRVQPCGRSQVLQWHCISCTALHCSFCQPGKALQDS